MSPFDNTNSIDADAANNMLRGLHKDNSDNSHTGDTNETDLASFTMSGGTMGATGALHIMASGDTTGTAGDKTITLYLGTSVFAPVIPAASGGQEWIYDVWAYNTATNAQRLVLRFDRFAGSGDPTGIYDTNTTSKDTTGNLDIKLTATLANSGDTITQKTFNIDIVQRT